MNVSHYLVQRVSGNHFEQHMVYMPHGECNCLLLFSLLLIVVQRTYWTSPEYSRTQAS